MGKIKIKLKEVRSVGFKKNDETWQEKFKIKVSTDGQIQTIESDLKNGLINTLQEIFHPSIYDYKTLDYYYSREAKPRKTSLFY